MTNEQNKRIDELFQKALKILHEKNNGIENNENPVIYLDEILSIYEEQEKQHD